LERSSQEDPVGHALESQRRSRRRRREEEEEEEEEEKGERKGRRRSSSVHSTQWLVFRDQCHGQRASLAETAMCRSIGREVGRRWGRGHKRKEVGGEGGGEALRRIPLALLVQKLAGWREGGRRHLGLIVMLGRVRSMLRLLQTRPHALE
jgi:hypothetical protein